MRILMLAPLGALFACAEGTGTDYESSAEPLDEERQHDQDILDLRGDYATCNDALVGLGFTPWTDYVEEETADWFEVVYDEDEVVRPWMATISFTEDDPGYYITCTEMDAHSTGGHMWVEPRREEYWTCTFQADFISILNPEADSNCSRALSEALRSDGEENYRYDLVEPGHFVAQE